MSPSGKGAPSQNGLLPMPTAILQKNAPQKPPKPASPKLKIVIRRLAPGLTQDEFEAALGGEWKCGAGKVDWVSYRPGSISTDAANPSLPSRAYLRVTDKAHIFALNQHVKETQFVDSKNTTRDPALIGPPVLEIALLQKVPSGKRKVDQRQGLIDQDPDFKAFLESLTNPITKPAPIDAVGEASTSKSAEKVTITPLIQHLRDKKAAQEAAKEAAKSKKGGKHAQQDAKADKAADKKAAKASKEVAASPSRSKRGAKADKTPVRVLTKESPASSKAAAAAATQAQGGATTVPTGPSAERRRERGNASLAAKIVQRDLGVLPSRGPRGKGVVPAPSTPGSREPAAKADSEASPRPAALLDGSSASAATPGRAAAGSAKETGRPAKGPRTRGPRGAAKAAANANATIVDKPNNIGSTAQPLTTPSTKHSAAQSAQPSPTILKKTPTPTPAAQPTPPPSTPSTAPSTSRKSTAPPPLTTTTITHAFLKHANPSQGITTDLLTTALAAHGPVVSCEIDRKKGYAYAEFATSEGLMAAVAASPVKVAEGAVEVLVRREKGGKGTVGGGGGAGQGGRGGHGGRGGRGRGRWGGGKGGGAGDGGAAPVSAAGRAAGAPP
ncbi:hypothetical protein P152DRAFT_510485 [Eremomyces bilateralis CBS 781.70]|uniref:UPF3 domain-containing protein n=1 Tax=Eremomyces bilateralis CBS 781.70 TaxID=1392243 RepID=A0A6G1GH61_9PEZI|nr:uncharacterized protein P152DRAFT_510485 [Eremomyces bilateralis CBS 781.70]KAF1817209.1 hypothetical protein P152DRAFT_510485 [Eremomyces bilateralis CBS 781.70]